MKKTLSLLCLALTLPLGINAATLSPKSSQVDAVTVFLDRAEVNRILEVSLQPGSHSIRVDNLPAQLIEASLRASGKGPQGLRVGSVETRRQFSEQVAQKEERKLRAELQALNDKKAQLDGRMQALNTQAAFIQRLANTPTQKEKDENLSFEPEKWATAWQAIGKGMGETNAARSLLKQETREIQQQIDKVKQQLRQVQTGRRDSLSAIIHVEAANAGRATFKLSYQIPNATWSANYDAHLTSENASVELRQLAHVRQSSGEAWDNVKLTVSTARPSAGAVMPELSPWWIDFPRPRPMAKQLRREKMGMMDAEMDSLAMAPAASTIPLEEEAREIVAEQQNSEFSVRYQIPGRVTVPADNSRQRFVLNKQQIKGKLGARSTPRRDPRAFLYAEFDYNGKSPLLAGNWQLQRDGVYVGSARQSAIRPGETVALAFGADDAILVEYNMVKNERAKQGLINREQRVDRQYRITVLNGHKLALPVTIYDQIPVSRDESIKVSIGNDTTPATEKDVDDRPGVMMWQQTLKAKETMNINFGYSISYPQDRSLPGF